MDTMSFISGVTVGGLGAGALWVWYISPRISAMRDEITELHLTIDRSGMVQYIEEADRLHKENRILNKRNVELRNALVMARADRDVYMNFHDSWEYERNMDTEEKRIKAHERAYGKPDPRRCRPEDAYTDIPDDDVDYSFDETEPEDEEEPEDYETEIEAEVYNEDRDAWEDCKPITEFDRVLTGVRKQGSQNYDGQRVMSKPPADTPKKGNKFTSKNGKSSAENRAYAWGMVRILGRPVEDVATELGISPRTCKDMITKENAAIKRQNFETVKITNGEHTYMVPHYNFSNRCWLVDESYHIVDDD